MMNSKAIDITLFAILSYFILLQESAGKQLVERLWWLWSDTKYKI